LLAFLSHDSLKIIQLISEQIERLKKVETKRIPQLYLADRIGEGFEPAFAPFVRSHVQFQES